MSKSCRPRAGGVYRAVLLTALLGGLLAIQPAPLFAASPSFARDEVLVHYRGDPGQTSVDVPAGQSVRATLSELRSEPAVGYARPDYLVHAAVFSPNDPGSDARGNWTRDQWNFLSPETRGGISLPTAWQRLIAADHPGGQGVTVAVLDTGVAYRKKGRRYRRDPDLPGVRRFVHPKDFIDGDRIPLDPDGHGTHVASTIAQATNNARGLTGIAYGSKVMPIRVLNRRERGKGSKVARGIRYATEHGADVINLSLDFKRDVTSCNQIVAVCHSIQHAIHERVVVVAAAGNEGGSRVLYPAAARGVIGVGASTYRGCAAEYTNYGGGLDLLAPGGGHDKGVDVTSEPRCDPHAKGYEVRQYSLLPGPADHGNYRRFGIVGMEGTSMASAHVSGVAALVLASRVCGRHPNPKRVTRRLRQTALDRGLPGKDDVYAGGLLNAAQATSPAKACRAG
jgi:serine protease